MYGSIWGDFLALGLFLLFQFCGLWVAGLLLDREARGLRLLLGSVCGSVMLQWFPVPFAFLLGFTTAAHFWGAGLAVACAALCLWAGKRKRSLAVPAESALPSARPALFLLVPALMTVFFGFLVLHSFRLAEGKIFSSQATFGDMSMHMSFITSLARQGDFPPDYSLMPGTRLSYPFLSDSISSSLYLCGSSLRMAYAVPMVFAGAQVFFGFYLFAERLLKSRGKAALAWLFFFLNGGFGFVYLLTGDLSWSDLFQGFYQTPTNLAERNLRWVNVVVDMMLPQRATLFGWAVLFPTLYLLYRAVFEGEKRYFLYVGVLAGLLPMIHTHSFLSLALICGTWLLFALLRELSLKKQAVRTGKILIPVGLAVMSLVYPHLRRLNQPDFLLWIAAAIFGLAAALLICLTVKCARRGKGRELLLTWGLLLGVTCLLALPQLFIWTFRQVGNGDMIRGHFGWILGQGEDGYLWFYLKNIGLVSLLALGGLLTADGDGFARWAPALVIWFLAELVEFQPNDYDNNKLLYVAYGLLCCAGAEFLTALLQRINLQGLRVALGAVCIAVCAFSALLTMGREAVAQYELFGQGALSLCDYVEANLEPDAVVLTDTRHNNEIAALTGRNIVCGSPSYLYFHGLPYGKSEWAAKLMYEASEESRELFYEFGVDYVLVSDFERSAYQLDEGKLSALFPKVFDDGSRALYRVEF